MEIKQVQQSFPVEQITPGQRTVQATSLPRTSFAEVLESKLAGATDVKFSAHASDRLASRNIVLSENDITKLSSAVSAMAQKGGKEGLVVMDNLAMIVNIQNKTVVTAVEKSPQTLGKVFTNIDSALIV